MPKKAAEVWIISGTIKCRTCYPVIEVSERFDLSVRANNLPAQFSCSHNRIEKLVFITCKIAVTTVGYIQLTDFVVKPVTTCRSYPGRSLVSLLTVSILNCTMWEYRQENILSLDRYIR